MRWILLLVGITLHSLVIGQATLKIYVPNDDTRSDMDIIDLNTSALDRYGQSVDSTNINYYTTTMSTQVLRMSRLELFGPEDIAVTATLEEEPMSAGIDFMEPEVTTSFENGTISNVQGSEEDEELSEPKTIQSTAVRSTSNNDRSVSSKSYRSRQRGKMPKKSRRNKRYRGQCPKFF